MGDPRAYFGKPNDLASQLGKVKGDGHVAKNQWGEAGVYGLTSRTS